MIRIAAVLLLTLRLASAQSAGPFLERPYLQLGDAPKLINQESLVLLWHTADAEPDWSVEVQSMESPASDGMVWRRMPAPVSSAIDVPRIPKHYVWRAVLGGLTPGAQYRYRVLKMGKPVFQATAKARKAATQPVRFVLFGDASDQTAWQRAIAYQTFLQHPDFVFITGDIVYEDGRISEYREKFFPVYNADKTSAETGAPLLRSIPFLATPGNHDTSLSSFRHFADALAYFYYWDQPLNGPPNPALRLIGHPPVQPAFKTAAENRWPVMANFSFDYGNAHWTVLDSNPYMDWSSPALRKWLADDLAAATGAAWRFVAFHHAAFHSSKENFNDQWMRQLAPLFEDGKVDVVFSGHVHNYQRSFPLKFVPRPQRNGAAVGRRGRVPGEFKLDKAFHDGAAGQPTGVIYVVSGGGGSALYNPEQMKKPAGWQPFTDKFIADVHSFTLVDIRGRTFELKQISETGAEVDALQITK